MNILSVVIPAYDEQQSIATVLDELKATLDDGEQSYEIIVVDDGSTDDTAKIVQQRGDVRLIQHPYNRGYGIHLTGTSDGNTVHHNTVLRNATPQIKDDGSNNKIFKNKVSP